MCADDIDHPIRNRDNHTAEIGPLHWRQVFRTFKRAQIEHQACCKVLRLSLIHISEPTRPEPI
eukprot:5707727-Pyramimonas_sp.AAC.1